MTQERRDEHRGSLTIGVLDHTYEIIDVMDYRQRFDGLCSLCWKRELVQLVEISFKNRRIRGGVRWMGRSCCPSCLRILDERATGKITHCPL